MNKDNIKVALEILKGSWSILDSLSPPVRHQVIEKIEKFDLPRYLDNSEYIAGMGIGLKNDQHLVDRKCIKIFTKRQLRNDEIRDLTTTTYKWLLGSGLGYVPVEVEYLGVVAPAFLKTKKTPPVQGGYSIGHYNSGSGGTFGCIVYCKDNGTSFILSNCHVIARGGLANPGDDVIQPCLKDGGRPGTDTIAQLHKMIPIKPSPHINIVDAALATPHVFLVPEIAILKQSPKGIAAPQIGMRVQKVGRTTGHTSGKILAIDLRVKDIFYPELNGTFIFDGLVLSDHRSEPGDSGAVVLNDGMEAIGLNSFIVNDPFFNKSLFIPIKSVCNALNVKVVI